MMRYLLIGFLTLTSSGVFGQTTASLVAQVQLDSLIRTVREFSGEDSTWVNDTLVRIQHRVSKKGNDLAADYLVDHLQALGLSVEAQNYRLGGRNIIATQIGKTNPDSIYIYGAHYDAVADYCADDNASGSAAVLEAARIMSNYCFDNTIKFAFWDEEERGLIGSRSYADTAFAHGDHILGVINTDMMGYDSDSDNVFDIHADSALYNLRMKDTILFMLDTLNLNLVPQVIIPGTTRTDHASFWRKDYPAVYFGESFLGGDPNTSYHSSKDRINLFNLTYYHNLAKLSVGVVAELAGIIPTAIEVDSVSACEQYTYRDTTFDESAVYRDSLKTISGCDSIYILILTILRNSYHRDTIAACEFYQYRGNTLDQSGIYRDTLTAINGCDSFYTMDLTIKKTQYYTDTIEACESYVYRGTTYNLSGLYHDTLEASNGCDSIYSMDLTIHNTEQHTDTIVACESYLYDGNLFIKSGIYPHVLTGQYGCDSTYIIDLTILPFTEHRDTILACGSFTFMGKELTETGIYRQSSIGQNGCDSFYVIDLHVTHLNDSIIQDGRTLTAMETDASYRWLICPSFSEIPGATGRSFTVSSDGSYAVEVSKNQCFDTSDCIEKIVSGMAGPNRLGANIYPNPSDGLVYVVLDKEYDWAVVQLFSPTRQIVHQYELIQQRSFQVQLPDESGLYFLNVITRAGIVSRKMIRK